MTTLKKTKSDLWASVSSKFKFPQTFDANKKGSSRTLLKVADKIKRAIDYDMYKTLEYNFHLTTGIASGNSFEIKKTHIETRKTTKSLILPLGFYDHKKSIFKWSAPTYVYFNKVMDTLSRSNMDVEILEQVIRPIFSEVIKVNESFYTNIPIFYAVFNPAFHLIKFQSYVNDDTIPALTLFSLVKLPQRSSLPQKTYDLFLDAFDFIASLIRLNDKIKSEKSLIRKKKKPIKSIKKKKSKKKII